MQKHFRFFEFWSSRLLHVVAACLEKDALDGPVSPEALVEEILQLRLRLKSAMIVPDSSHETQGETTAMAEKIVLELGGSVELPASRKRGEIPRPHLHWCASCRELFATETPHPARCRKCGVKHWRRPYPRAWPPQELTEPASA